MCVCVVSNTLSHYLKSLFLVKIFIDSSVFTMDSSLLFLLLSAIGPGIFLLNLVCRNIALRNSVLERVRAVFPTMLSKKIEGDVNEVLLCSREKESSETKCVLPSLNQEAKSLQSALCFSGTGTAGNSPHIDIAETLKGLKVL